jgi:HK97 family phage portal protein
MFDFFKKKAPAKADLVSLSLPEIRAMAEGMGANVREALMSLDGGRITVKDALKNTGVLRCTSLISRGIGMLPLYIMQKGADGKNQEAIDHPIYDLLRYRPNPWQTPLDFIALNQLRVLYKGEAVNKKVMLGNRIVALIPLHPDYLSAPKQRDDFSIYYEFRAPGKEKQIYESKDLFIIRGLSDDGIQGASLIEAAANVIDTARQAEIAANAIFKNGLMTSGYFHSPEVITLEKKQEIQKVLQEGFMGAINAGRTPLIDLFEYKQITTTPADAQHIETRSFQIEEILRVFGVPRSLVMMDETSWGSGIEQLALLFVQFTLAPHFVAWEQAIQRDLLTLVDLKSGIYADFDERELLRGDLKSQAEYFSKALGGQKGWMSQDEVRITAGLGKHQDKGADSITPAIAIGKAAA